VVWHGYLTQPFALTFDCFSPDNFSSMKKIVLRFPSGELMAEFILACKIKGDIDPVYFTIISHFDDECIQIAIDEYEAVIAGAPDFIIPD
jgi:hypothetical protein